MEFHNYLGFDHSKNLKTSEVEGKIAKKNLAVLLQSGEVVFQGNLFEKGETIIWTKEASRPNPTTSLPKR